MGKRETKLNMGEIETLFAFYDELDVLAEQTSNAIKNSKLNLENQIEITRVGEKKPITISEKLAWDEVRLLGKNTECYPVLAEKYPECFELSAKHQAKADEINEFAIKTFEITSSTRMTLRDILKITLAVKGME
jgi:hypothetical protein